MWVWVVPFGFLPSTIRCHTRLAFAVAFSELTQMQAAKPAVLAMPAVPAVPAARRARLRQGTMNLSTFFDSDC